MQSKHVPTNLMSNEGGVRIWRLALMRVAWRELLRIMSCASQSEKELVVVPSPYKSVQKDMALAAVMRAE